MSGRTGKLVQMAGAIGHSVQDNLSGGLLLGKLLSSAVKFGGFTRRGVVAFHNPGTYGVVVALDDGTCVSCTPPNFGSGSMYGVGTVYSGLIEPGTPVIILQYAKGAGTGTILCVSDHQMVTDNPGFRLAKSDEGAAMHYRQENAYSLDSTKRNFRLCGTGMYKASDTYPGDWMISNEFGMEYFLGRTRATIRGSNLSRIDFFPIDDILRITAGYLQEYTHGGYHTVFADKTGFVSEELLFSPYVWETAGCRTRARFEAKMTLPPGDNTPPPGLGNPDMARYREYQGSIAGGKQIFVSYPKNGKNIGLSHVALSDSGAVVVRSTSDIILTTTRKISVPSRTAAPENPDGVDVPKVEYKDEMPDPSDWWMHDVGRRTASNIISQLYKRFKDNPKDWKIDSEKAKTLYDKNVLSMADVTDGTGQIFLGHDGSIVLSTSEGAEIRLHGPDITISCPGKLSFRSGSEVSMLSKQDIIIKSKENTEVMSSNRTLVSSAGRVAVFGGISVFAEVGDSGREDTRFPLDVGNATPGMYLKVASGKGLVLVDSDDIYLHPRSTLGIMSHMDGATKAAAEEEERQNNAANDEGGGGGGNGEGGEGEDMGYVPKNSQVVVSIGRVVVSTHNMMVNTGDEEPADAGLILAGGQAALFGARTIVTSDSVPIVTGGGKIPMYLPGGESDVYRTFIDSMKSIRTPIMYEPMPMFEDIPRFSYRDYTDLDTGTNIEVEESPWVNFKNVRDTWGWETEVNETLPWPGKRGKCVMFMSDYSRPQLKLKENDDAFGDKKNPVAKPKKEVLDFEFYRG